MIESQPLSEEVPLEDLPKLVQRVWDDYRTKVQRPVVRIASFNLLVVSGGKIDPELVTLVDGLHSSHPARVIWTRLSNECQWKDSCASLSLTTRCEGQQVCSEQIMLNCGDDPARIPSIVLPLIHPGLPTHLLWWKSGPLDSQLFLRLLDRSRLALWQPVADPSSWAMEYLLRSWSDPYRKEHAIYPVDWFRLRGMRRQIAMAYDRGALSIRASDPGAKMSLAHQLLKSWLESRLPADSGLQFRWTSGPQATELLSPQIESLGLDDLLVAARVALDNTDRDPIFEGTLRKLVGPT